jgi:hypothetical protein
MGDKTFPKTYPRHPHGRQHLVTKRYRITVRVLSNLHGFALSGSINILRHVADICTALEQRLRCRGLTVYNNLYKASIQYMTRFPMYYDRLTNFLGATLGMIVLIARPSLSPSRSTKSRRQASCTSTSVETYFDGTSSGTF